MQCLPASALILRGLDVYFVLFQKMLLLKLLTFLAKKSSSFFGFCPVLAFKSQKESILVAAMDEL